MSTYHQALITELENALCRYDELVESVSTIGSKIRLAKHLVEQENWYHEEHHERPEDIYPFGPIRGTKMKLAEWIYETNDPRRIERANQHGAIWIVRVGHREYEVWFMSNSVFSEVQAKRLSEIRARKK